MATTIAKKEQEIRPFFEDFFDISPFTELTSFRRKMNSLFDTVMRPATYQDWTLPALDLYRKNGSYVVEVALPGLEKKDINVEIEGNCLTVSGKYIKEEEEKEKQYHYRELRRGSFCRSVSFPENLEPEKVTANFEKGMLRIEVPALREVEAKKVAIK